jgi:hypothetical protein
VSGVKALSYRLISSLLSTNLLKYSTAQTLRTPMIPITLPEKSNCKKSIGTPLRMLMGKGWEKGGGKERGRLGKASLYAWGTQRHYGRFNEERKRRKSLRRRKRAPE